MNDSPPPLEVQIGMEMYSTRSRGIGGRLKVYFEDFIVEEIDSTGHVLTIDLGSDDIVESSITGEKQSFVTFKLQKMGLTTHDVCNILASGLSLPRNLVTYAGLKDKRAITTQAFSVPASAVARFADLELSRISIRSLHYTKHPIQIGDLWGNRFTITLRGAEDVTERALELVRSLKEMSLLNYFGVQRFGLTRPYTHLIGKALVKKDYEEAISVILTMTSEYESEELTDARLLLAEEMTPTEDIIAAFPSSLRYERSILKRLRKRPTDFEGAFMRVPPRLLTLFVHAYQSYVFNRLISRRVRTGYSITEPVVGDFLIKLDAPHSGRDSWLYVTEKNLDDRRRLVEEGTYGLAAPVPGYSTKTPPSPQSRAIVELLKEDGIRLLDFRNPENRALDSAGGLRTVSTRPQDFVVDSVNEMLRVSFALRKGSYATVIMREIMKNHPKYRA